MDMTGPSASGEGGVGVIEAALNPQDDDGEDDTTGTYTSVDQLSSSMLTMSLVPRTRWQTLLNLDVIKVNPSFPTHSPYPLGKQI